MFYGTEQKLQEQLDRIESKLDQLLARSQQDVQALSTADPYQEVRAFISQGQKINAIKRYRELTNVGLKEAKEAVEAMEASPTSPTSPTSPAAVSSSSLSASDLERVRALIVAGQKIQAVKLYRDLTNVSLKEAKDVVDSMPLTGSSW